MFLVNVQFKKTTWQEYYHLLLTLFHSGYKNLYKNERLHWPYTSYLSNLSGSCPREIRESLKPTLWLPLPGQVKKYAKEIPHWSPVMSDRAHLLIQSKLKLEESLLHQMKTVNYIGSTFTQKYKPERRNEQQSRQQESCRM